MIKNAEWRDTKSRLSKRLDRNIMRNLKLNGMPYKWPEKIEKCHEGFWRQWQRSKVLKTVTLFTEQKQVKLLDPFLTSDLNFAKALCSRLREPHFELFSSLFKGLGREASLDVLESVSLIQNSGGLLNSQFKGFKTPGGVFLYLVKIDDRLRGDLTLPQLKIILKRAKADKKQSRFI